MNALAIIEQLDGGKQRHQGVLAVERYAPVYGARPLKRVIRRDVLNPLSLKLFDGNS